mgnify:CR=1 FL=1
MIVASSCLFLLSSVILAAWGGGMAAQVVDVRVLRPAPLRAREAAAAFALGLLSFFLGVSLSVSLADQIFPESTTAMGAAIGGGTLWLISTALGSVYFRPDSHRARLPFAVTGALILGWVMEDERFSVADFFLIAGWGAWAFRARFRDQPGSGAEPPENRRSRG